MINKGMFTSKTEEWATPIDFFKKVDKEFKFTLDVCATAENAKCNNFYTKEDNGLNKAWEGCVWCNPPYGREIDKWVRKAQYEANKNADLIVMLLPARTDTKWFHDVCLKHEIRFIKGRLHFNESKQSAPFPSMLVVMRGKNGSN